MAEIKRIREYSWLIKILPIVGFSFWFFLTFPFGNRNEGFVWSSYFEQYNLFEILIHPISSIKNYRPLAQFIGWILYHVAGGNGNLIQLFNYVTLIVSILAMAGYTSKDTLSVRVLYFLVGLIYITSFYYVFNLYGIFYSPIVLFIALLLRSDVIHKWKVWLAVSFTLTFFHPFIAIIYLAFLTGLIIEKRDFTFRIIWPYLVSALVLLISIKLLNPRSGLHIIHMDNLVGCMRNVEANKVISLFSLVLCFLTLLGKSRVRQGIILTLILIYTPFAIMGHWPFLLLLAAILMLSLLIEKKWSLLGLLSTSILFPLIVESGAPTKTVIFLFLAPYLILRNYTFQYEIKEWIPKTFAVLSIVSLILFIVVSRMGIEVPVLSSMIRPITVERGKTLQLEKCLDLARGEKPHKRIEFLQRKGDNIRDEGQPKKRDYLAPAKQDELDAYIKSWNAPEVWSSLPNWYISFGMPAETDSLELIYTVEENTIKPAFVYRAH